MGPELAERRRAPGSSFKPNVWVLPQGRVTGEVPRGLHCCFQPAPVLWSRMPMLDHP